MGAPDSKELYVYMLPYVWRAFFFIDASLPTLNNVKRGTVLTACQ